LTDNGTGEQIPASAHVFKDGQPIEYVISVDPSFVRAMGEPGRCRCCSPPLSPATIRSRSRWSG
jgi:hypothetical protein